MNKELHEAYGNLSDTQKASLKNRYKDSPVAMSLIQFLTAGTEPDFKTADAVTFIYGDEAKHKKYGVLENRYFKLRKKLHDEISNKPANESYSELPEEEAMLNRCKQLIAAGDKKEGYRLLTALEKICWERNIFELLPSILDNMIFCNQGFNELERNKPIYKSLEEAIKLQYDLNRAIMFIRQVYESFFSLGPGADKDLLLALKELGDKHKGYPRFIMLYHYVSASYKLSSMHYANNMQVISRHLSEFKRLYTKHSTIPIVIYKAGYEKLFHFHYNQVTTFYHTNRCEYEEAYHSTKEMFSMAFSGDPLFRTYRTNPLFFNMFTMQCLTGRYRDALDTCDKLSSYMRQTGTSDKLPMVNMMRGILYVTAYPQTFKLDYDYLLEKAGEYIQLMKKEGDAVQLPITQAMLFKAEMNMLHGDYKNALKITRDAAVKQYLQSLKADDLFEGVFAALADGDGLHEVAKKITQRRYKAVKIDEFMTYKWLSDFIGRSR